MDYTVVSGSELHLTEGALTPAVSVMANGMGSMFTIFMQFLPAILAVGLLLFTIAFLRGMFVKRSHGESSFKTSIKN